MIVALIRAGFPQRQVAARFKVSHQMVARIGAGKHWWYATDMQRMATPAGRRETPAAQRARRLAKRLVRVRSTAGFPYRYRRHHGAADRFGGSPAVVAGDAKGCWGRTACHCRIRPQDAAGATHRRCWPSSPERSPGATRGLSVRRVVAVRFGFGLGVIFLLCRVDQGYV
jgi:hypothetical protein